VIRPPRVSLFEFVVFALVRSCSRRGRYPAAQIASSRRDDVEFILSLVANAGVQRGRTPTRSWRPRSSGREMGLANARVYPARAPAHGRRLQGPAAAAQAGADPSDAHQRYLATVTEDGTIRVIEAA
jgi:hypothetical protein